MQVRKYIKASFREIEEFICNFRAVDCFVMCVARKLATACGTGEAELLHLTRNANRAFMNTHIFISINVSLPTTCEQMAAYENPGGSAPITKISPILSSYVITAITVSKWFF